MSSILSEDSSYARRRQEHVALVNQLRAIGAQADLDLPRVAVIGNQSAGKSSLVEAISGITVPRDAGTCTRCPIECRMFKSEDPFSCQISIRWEFQDDSTRAHDVLEAQFGPRLTDTADVELMLRRAQAAVLNPDSDTRKFVTMSAKELKPLGGNQLQFSRNTVCIDLSGPGLTDLAFIDLPGIIQNAQPDIVTLVEELVASHIRGNCIILVTLPMSDDIENQKAMRLAQEADPEGVRTIGVLTKPDAIPAGAARTKALWLEIIEGRRFPLKLGYFCTRQPDEAERTAHATHNDARAAESHFFANTSPWSDSTHVHRFGTRQLVMALGDHLARIIDESLPRLAEETQRQLHVCEASLAALPEPITSDPFTFLLNLINAFCSKMRLFIEGHLDAASLVQANRKAYAKFKKSIRGTAPHFVPYEKVETTRDLPIELFKLDSFDDPQPVQPTSLITLAQVHARISDATMRELPNNVPYVAKLSFVRDFQSKWGNIARDTTSAVHNALEELIQDQIESQVGQYAHFEPHFRHAVKMLLELKLKDTEKQILKILKYESTAFTQNDHYLSDAKDKFLAYYKNARAKGIEHTSNLSMSSQGFSPAPVPSQPQAGRGGTGYITPGTIHLDPSRTWREQDSVNPSVLLDYISVSTLPGYRSWSHEELRVSDYQEGRKLSTHLSGVALTDADRVREEAEVLEALKRLGFHGLSASDLSKLRPGDKYEEELSLMAEVRAYFKVAYKRIIDYVPLAIDHELLYTFADELQTHLVGTLGLGTGDISAKCAAYLAEDPNVVIEREELLARKKRLLSVQFELRGAGV